MTFSLRGHFDHRLGNSEKFKEQIHTVGSWMPYQTGSCDFQVWEKHPKIHPSSTALLFLPFAIVKGHYSTALFSPLNIGSCLDCPLQITTQNLTDVSKFDIIEYVWAPLTHGSVKSDILFNSKSLFWCNQVIILM